MSVHVCTLWIRMEAVSTLSYSISIVIVISKFMACSGPGAGSVTAPPAAILSSHRDDAENGPFENGVDDTFIHSVSLANIEVFQRLQRHSPPSGGLPTGCPFGLPVQETPCHTSGSALPPRLHGVLLCCIVPVDVPLLYRNPITHPQRNRVSIRTSESETA